MLQKPRNAKHKRATMTIADYVQAGRKRSTESGSLETISLGKEKLLQQLGQRGLVR